MNRLMCFFALKFLMFLAGFLSVFPLHAQELSLEDIQKQAKESFSSLKYAEASDLYRKLYAIYPKEPDFNYYLGRCYLGMNQDIDKSIQLLKFAASKNCKADVHFYLAQAYYSNNQYNEAEVALRNFKNIAKKKLQVQLNVDNLQRSIAKAKEEDLLKQEILVNNTENLAKPEIPEIIKNTDTPINAKNESPTIQPKVNSANNSLLQNALEQQLICDSIFTQILEEKNCFRTTKDMKERQELSSSIAKLEQCLSRKQIQVDSLFNKAKRLDQKQVTENEEENNSIALIKEVNGLKVYSYLPDSEQNNSKSFEMKSGVKEGNKSIQTKINSQFKILPESPYNAQNPIPENLDLPDCLVYKIQLGSFSKTLSMNAFGGLTPISTEFIADQKITKYYVGVFASSKDAHAALEEVKRYGFSDAFVVPYYKKQKITIHAARELEFGQKLNTN